MKQRDTDEYREQNRARPRGETRSKEIPATKTIGTGARPDRVLVLEPGGPESNLSEWS